MQPMGARYFLVSTLLAFAALLAEKQERYAEYKTLRQDMIAYRMAKQNVDRILGLMPEEQEQQGPER